MLPLLWIGSLFFLTFFTSGKARRAAVLTDAAPMEPRRYALARCAAALAGAALLGAPLMHDFCVISLSDLLTPWDQIAKRLVCAAEGDSVIVLYNPGSKRRRGHLRRACEILLERKHPETVCGWVRNVGREGSEVRILSLQALKETEVDMFTTVFIGSSTTQRIGRWMVTPRGYENK